MYPNRHYRQQSSDQLFSVNGLVAVVTGGGTGLGLMIARTLASNGAAKVFIVGRTLAVLEAAAEQCGVNGNVKPLQADVSTQADLERIATIVEQEVGYVNLLVSNAGIPGPDLKGLAEDCSISELQAHLWATTMSDFNRVFEVNVSAVFYTMVAFLKLLDAGNRQSNMQSDSQIIVTSSIAGFNRVPTGGFAYGSSKAAVNHVVKTMSTFLAGRAIRTNAIVPGSTCLFLSHASSSGAIACTADVLAVYPSMMTARSFQLTDEANLVSKNVVPLGRMGDQDDIAGLILFLASRGGAYCDGAMMMTDGGRLGMMPSTY